MKTGYKFFRNSGVYIALTFLTSAAELGFNGVAARLPEGVYNTFWALMRLFFIAVAPLTAVQLMVSKEIAFYGVKGEYGKRKDFIIKSFVLTAVYSFIIISAGLFSAGYIKEFLRLDTVFPVLMLLLLILAYSPIPCLYGVVQGMMMFRPLGLLQSLWGFSRLGFALVIVIFLGGGLDLLMIGIAAATILLVLISFIPAGRALSFKPELITPIEFRNAYSLLPGIVGTIFAVTVLKNADVVFANRLFDPASADAYAAAALVGSGFFMLSGIYMVMFPMVSEETARGGNPIIFFWKSSAAIIGLSLPALFITWFFPEFVLDVITLGQPKPGAEPLIRMVGFAAIPAALIFLTSNYLLAKHKSGYLPILLGGVALQFSAMMIFHSTPLIMLYAVIFSNLTVFGGMAAYVYFENNRTPEIKPPKI